MADTSKTITEHLSHEVQHSLSTPVERDAPSSEWASSTLKALGPITTEPYPPDQPYNTQTNLSLLTPSDQVPGAYPRGPVDPLALSQDVEYVKEAASQALETAKEYAYSAGEVVGRYLPASVAPYLPRNSITHEHRHLNEPEDDRSEELPGPHGEFLADAQVPDDVEADPTFHSSKTPADNSLLIPNPDTSGVRSHLNVDDQQSTTASSRFQGASEDASTRSLPGSRADLWSHTPGTSLRPSSRRESMKNAESVKTFFSATAGVSGIPDAQVDSETIEENQSSRNGTNSEQPRLEHETNTNVAPVTETLSPSAGPHTHTLNTTGRDYPPVAGDEFPSLRHDGNTLSSGEKAKEGEDIGDVVTAAAKQKDTLPSADKGEAGNVKNPTTPSPNDTHKSAPVTSGSTFLAMKDDSAKVATPTRNLPPEEPTATTTEDNSFANGASITQTPSKAKSGSSNGKPGFLNKLRGEIKILSGKMEHSNEKIEEGRRLLGKSPKFKN